MGQASGYFGIPSPTREFATRVRWVIGALLTCVLIFGATIVLLLSKDLPMTPQPAPVAAIAPTSCEARGDVVEVVVAKDSIARGDRLTSVSFRTQAVPRDLVPPGILLGSDLKVVDGKFAREPITRDTLVLQGSYSDTAPVTPFHIAPGFRAVSIEIDARSGVEGFAKPSTLVDVLWIYVDETKEKKIATIVRSARVLSVAGTTNSEATSALGRGTFTATLLATERDAKAIQLASATGALMLSLVGEEERPVIDAERAAVDASTMQDFLRVKKTETTPGKIEYWDASSRKTMRFRLSDNGWEPAEEKAPPQE